MPGTNTLAYFAAASVTKTTKFYDIVPKKIGTQLKRKIFTDGGAIRKPTMSAKFERKQKRLRTGFKIGAPRHLAK